MKIASASLPNSALLKRMVTAFVMIFTFGLMLTQENERLFWPFLCSTLFIASLTYGYERYLQINPISKTYIEYMFPKNVWLHRSAIDDYRIAIINFAIIALIFPFLAFKIEYSFKVIYKTLDILNDHQSTVNPGLLIITLYTLTSFALSDLGYYLIHKLMHRWPLLWEFHKVHHSAEVLTPITVHRAHPVDVWLSGVARTTGLGIAAGIFIYFFPSIQGVTIVLGVNLVVFIFYMTSANLNHSHIPLRYGKYLEHIFLSPAQHHIHHSADPKHYNKNFGSFLAIWDWIFGSIYIVKKKEKLTYGLGKKDMESLSSLKKLYITPCKNFWKRLKG